MGGDEERIRESLLVKNESFLEEGGGSLSDSSVTPVVLFSILVASCGALVSGCGVGFSSPVQKLLMSELSLSTPEFSMFGSLCTAGGLLGSIMSGKISDYLGRRGTMGVTAINCLIGWLAIAFAKDAWLLYLGRLITGIGMGLISYVVPVYTAEITPKNHRGGAVLTYMLAICCGISLMFFGGLAVNWRILALIGTVPCILQIISLPFIPESPRWLVMVGREKEYKASLQRLRGHDVDISLEASDIKEHTESVKNIQGPSLLALFQRKYAYSLTLGLGLMALAQLGGTMGIICYASAIFESAGFSTTIGTISMAIVQIPVTIVALVLMDRLGRVPLLLVSAVGMCMACTLAGLSFLLKDLGLLTNISPSLGYIGILLFSAAYPMGMGGIPYIIMAEVFPLNVKGTAGSLATTVNCVTSWIVSYAFNFLLDWNLAGTFFIFAFVNVFTFFFVFKWVPETKGRTLEEIQDSITK